MPILTNTSFNPYTQNITILLADGVTPLTVSLSFVDANVIFDAALAINYGTQLGACFVMLFITIILTKSGKKNSPIFVLNILSLLFGFLRMLFKEFYFTSSWVKTYPSVSFDNSAIATGAKLVTVFGLIWTLLMLMTVAASLALQAHVVLKNIARLPGQLLFIFSVMVVLAAITIRFVDTVENCIASVGGTNFFGGTWLQYGALIAETIMIAWFCVLFTGKLGYTLYIRQKNGWQQWSAVKVLTAMGGCTMLIPACFTALNFVPSTHSFPEAGTLALTLVALLLPFSSLWASAAIDEENASLNIAYLTATRDKSRRGSSSDHSNLEAGKTTISQMSQSTALSAFEYYGSDERKSSVAPMNNIGAEARIEHVPHERRDSTEMDLAAMGVRVNHSYGVRTSQE